MIGQTLGNYRITEQIGIGGMATVYKAYDPDMDRYVAIKILPHQFSQDSTFKERFQREARAIAKLEHIHILPIFGYGEDNGTTYMVMRYLQAGTLTDRIKQGPMPLPQAARLLAQIAGALDYAHTHNILHRDVKPSNVLLDAQSNTFLTDFGIAKMVESTVDLTGTGILGTPAYMSPEQCRGSKELTPATDQYSLGIVVYEMITGRTPYQAETPIALIHMQLNEPLPLPRSVRPDLPEEAERAILKALSKDPESRYPTCRNFADAFTQAAQLQQSTLATPPADTLIETTDAPTVLHKPQSTPKAGQPHRIWAAFTAAIVVILLAGLGIFALSTQDKTSPKTVAEDTDKTQPVAAAVTPTQPPTPVTQPSPTTQGEVVPHPAAALPPAEALEMAFQFWANWAIEPCSWNGSDSGLCLSSWDGESEPIQILADSGLEFIDAPGFSPDGRQIVFSAAPVDSEGIYDEANIFIANLDGSNLIELPQPGSQVAPAWSPNGEWLTFAHNGHLAIMRPNGDDLQTILELEEGSCANRPHWSPDSEKVVVSIDELCDDRLPITRHVVLVADQGETVTPLVTTVYNTRDCVDFATAFTPNGEQVAYIDQECQAYLVNTAGSSESEPIPDFPWRWRAHFYPPWQELLFVDRCEYLDIGGAGECIHSNLRNLSRILEDTSIDLDRGGGPYSFSPDGTQLVFSRAEPPDTNPNSLYTINVDGSGLTPVALQTTDLPSDPVEPVWSPDGQWLAFTFTYYGYPAMARPDGSDFTILQELDCAHRLAWSPDSQWLVVSVQLEPSTCEYAFPQTRGIKLISPTTGEIIPLSEVAHPRECDEFVGRVAFNRTGQYVAYYDEDCRPVAVNRDNPDQRMPFSEFPWWWENYVYPQWGGVTSQPSTTEGSRCPPGQTELFLDDFENGIQSHWSTGPGSPDVKKDNEWEIDQDGGNHFLVGHDHYWAVTGNEAWQNYVMQLDLRRTSNESDAHINIYMGEGRRYMVHLNAGVLKRDNQDNDERDKILDHVKYQPDTQWHQLSLAAINGQIEVHLDGQPVAAYTDLDPLPGGPIGLENISGVIWYDNVLVCSIP